MASTELAVPSIAEPSVNNSSFSKAVPWWYVFFFFSGFPALLYQIVWQRALFTLYGVNIESVTMVVTAFLLGLGLGSLIGGSISQYQRLPLLRIFGVVELLIAVYGIVSLRIFHWAANFTAGSPPVETGLVAFTLVVIPTVLMGSTLPILVSHTVRLSRNVGTSVGALYAVNTLGSSAACFYAGHFLMGWLGQSGTVLLAASLNAVVGATVLVWHYAAEEQRPGNGEQPAADRSRNGENVSNSGPCIGFSAALATAAVGGFISLGYEIVWYRLFSFTTAGLAASFAFLLGAYLAGIGAGSLLANAICSRFSNSEILIRVLIASIFAANLVAFLVGPILFQLVVHVSYLWTLVPIGIAALFLGVVFPLLCHISVPPDERTGRRMSFIYLSNIIGSALGSYVTGFVLMDIFPLRTVSVELALLGVGLGMALMFKAQLDRLRFTAVTLGAIAAALFVISSSSPLFHEIYEKMLYKEKYASGNPFRAVVENRSGVIAVSQWGTVYGGGIYDGRFNVSLINDTNAIQRIFALSYFCANPKDVLMIGLSSGSWAQVLASHPQVEHLTIVEINPGYLPLIQHEPRVASLLRNRKVQIEIDDGRRWLVRNTGRRFDAIVMNTSYHWRSNASNILSTEFLRLIRQHLNPGGVHFYNTTFSDEVLATGVQTFPYGMRVANFLVLSDTPLQLDLNRWHDVLTSYKIDGKLVFDLSQEQHRQRLAAVLSMVTTMDRPASPFFALESAPSIRARTRHVRIITDDNMGTEWLR